MHVREGKLTFRIDVVRFCMSEAGSFHRPIFSHGSPGSMHSFPLSMQMYISEWAYTAVTQALSHFIVCFLSMHIHVSMQGHPFKSQVFTGQKSRCTNEQC